MGHGARVLIERLRMRQDNIKSLGQHFLNNEEVLDETMNLSNVKPEDHVIEIGPGPGVLTERLLDTGCTLTAIELDSGACEFLRDNFPSLNLIEGDALQIKWPTANKVVANIPYQISSPLIDAITRTPSIEEVVILVQEEFAERLVVEWESDKGSLGMCTMMDWDCTFEMRVGPHCFTPSPQVHSRLVTMTRIESPENSKLAKLLIRQAFAQRRKKIRNTLSRAPKRIARVSGWHAKAYRDAMQSIDCDFFDERPEDLDLEDWLELARLLEDARAAMG
ncbi:MAG: ribosomal RNA small subunit methyltransferase A [Euryarchaeota archaeon]|jgi:16S rRNA (adenine1518-N6/adenine1519-N6)-dimethyltransferase|nr:ribosomal RNA small subunit methyltransferase A [Euryarchaeota archaeon]MBT7244977.1 ribosomal RNA small subunit methyltransferase A [Euryarchaeota archaeon]NCF97377.1 ribosomal RNA small subunit methyltransferase A [Euryarchaeota archaeon]